jgi:hypothetical protein
VVCIPSDPERAVKEITQLAAELGRRLQLLNTHVSTAESCTGGGIAEAITRIPGSSAWFEAGYVTYSNRQKTQQLSVPQALFETRWRRQSRSGRGHGDWCSGEQYWRDFPWRSAVWPGLTAARQRNRWARSGWLGRG